MKIDTTIFKAYDIRGIYPTQLDEKITYRIGRAYAHLLQQENPDEKLKIVVGNDMRLSSPQLKKNLISGLLDSGVDVIDIDLVSTPTFYFAVAFYKYHGGIQVSASHNPKEWNGFKLVRAKAVPISGGKGMEDLKNLVVANKFIKAIHHGKLTKKIGVLDELIKEQSVGIDLSGIKPYKIAVDAANAMGSLDMQAMFKIIPCQLVKINFKLDGTFPVHEADPFKNENLKFLQRAVLKHRCDFGISIDGDGDRYFIVDEKGQLIRQEILRGIMAQLALKKQPGATVCYDIRPGRITKDMIDEMGGKSVVTKVGHSLIKEKMIEVGAVYGGESSGHFFYKYDYGVFEAPVDYILKLLEFISKLNKPISQIVKPYQKYFHSGEINSVIDDPDGKMEQLKQIYSAGELSELDGITFTFKNFWFNVRKSNTEPKLRLNLEAIDRKTMEQKRDEIINLIRS